MSDGGSKQRHVSTCRMNINPPANGGAGAGTSKTLNEGTDKGAHSRTPLRSLDPPVFTEPLGDCSVVKGGDITLRGVLTGSQPIKVSWVHNGKKVGFGKASFNGKEVSFVAKDCSLAHSGAYTCLAENSKGKTSSCAAVCVTDSQASSSKTARKKADSPQSPKESSSPKISANQNPDGALTGPSLRFENPPQLFEVLAGETARLACFFTASPPVVSCWIRGKDQIVDGSELWTENTDRSSTLVIEKAKLQQTGRYTVVVMDRKGSAQHTLTLSVIEKPTPPASCPVISIISPTCLVLSWSGPCYDGGSAILGYKVEVKSLGPTKPGDWTEVTAQCKSTSYRVSSGLQPQEDYCFRVKAYNAAGVSDASPESPVTKMELKAEDDTTTMFPMASDKHVIPDQWWFSTSFTWGARLGQDWGQAGARLGPGWGQAGAGLGLGGGQAGDRLGTGWDQVGDRLRPGWGQVGARLGTGGGQAGDRWGPGWGQAGDRLGPGWGQAGARLGPGWGQVGDRRGPGWGQVGGRGKFGEVFKLTHKVTGREYAGKFYKGRRAKERESARHEIELMNFLHHPQLVQCVAAYDQKPEMVMVMEFIRGGELFERIVDDNFEHTEPACVHYIEQLVQGIAYMHDQNIIHLDLKPENIVCVDLIGTAIKIIDFGLACKLDPNVPLTIMQGTPEFVAPEVINYEPVLLASDMWSVGVICYILLSGESPFQGNSDAETLALVTAAKWEFDDESFEDITEQAKSFISSLLNKDPRQRMTCAQALAHPWMGAFDSEDPSNTKSLSKQKMKRFLAKQKWKKAGKAILALKRMALLSKGDVPAGPPTTPGEDSAITPETEHVLKALELKMQGPPQFSKSLEDQTAARGSDARLSCHLTGYPDPEVVWLCGTEPVVESSRVQIEYEEDGRCTLVLTKVGPGDANVYTCRATNGHGEAKCSAKLTVKA
ncbi:myosin light chain kinase, smooth muscle-like [Diretmus argenteus]